MSSNTQVCKMLATTKLSKTDINAKRKKVLQLIEKEVGKKAGYIHMWDISASLLRKIIAKIDSLFLRGVFQSITYSVCWNARCTKTAGYCKYKKKGCRKPVTIELANRVLEFASFPACINGFKVKNAVSALIHVVEHEMVHALIYWYCLDQKHLGDFPMNKERQIVHGCPQFGKAGGSGHTQTFMSIVRNRFGQTLQYHDLHRQVNGKQGKTRNDFMVGQKVLFSDKEGVITKLNPKRARVRVNRNTTYTVPYILLT